ncbi:hypothetical protein RJT34_10777 [Clitoria ternatea]|uniref:Uncharacterized protein n=1 Tax=Clitoria ternatea TaxID=43366 RepID=A0AAN9PIU9_CLITE
MAFQPKTEPGSPPGLHSTTHINFKDLSISELVSVLRSSYEVDEFDRVEQELVTRDANLKAEIGPLKVKIELQRLATIEANEKLKNKEKEYETGKKAKESYESLLKKIKSEGLVGQNIFWELKTMNDALAEVRCVLEVENDGNKNALAELRSKNLELESENCELKQKLLEESNAMAELRSKVRVLEDEKVADKDALATLRIVNCNLINDNSRLEALVKSFKGKIVRLLEDGTKLLKRVETEADRGNHTSDPSPLQRNEDTHHFLGAATVKSRRKKNNDAPSESENYKDMSIPELVSVLRSAYEMYEFDRVEHELVTRDANLKERIAMIEAKEELKKEESCERGEKAKESYESFLKKIKSESVVDKNSVGGELKSKNDELKALKRKWVDDSVALAQARYRIGVLEVEKVGYEKALDALKMKNAELEEEIEKNLKTIEELMVENCKLAYEKGSKVLSENI